MDIRDLRCVIAVAEGGSFLRAAERLNISQPSISTRIRDLEAELGVRLFERESRGVRVTQEGADLLKHARLILRQMEEAEAELQQHATSPTGLVRLGLPTSLTGLLAVPLLERCLDRLPHVKLRIIEGMSGHIIDWLLTAKLDIGLIFGKTPPSGIETRAMVVEDLRIAAGDAEALRPLMDERGEVPFAALSRVKLILPGPEHGLRMLIDTQAEKQRTRLDVTIEIDAFGEIKRLVRRCFGHTILSSAALHDFETGAGLASARIVDPPISRIVNLATAARRPLSRADRAVAGELERLIYERAATPEWNAKVVG